MAASSGKGGDPKLLQLLTPPAVEPITLAEAKAHLRVEHADEDSLITSLVTVARRLLERYTARSFITQTWKLTLDEFPGSSDEIRLWMAPVQSVTSIQYKDESGTLQTLAAANYIVSTACEPGRIKPAYTMTWPTSYDEIDAVTVTYVAGYGDVGASIPDELRHAMKLLIGDLYKDRENPEKNARTDMIPLPILWLCEPYRIFEFR